MGPGLDRWCARWSGPRGELMKAKGSLERALGLKTGVWGALRERAQGPRGGAGGLGKGTALACIVPWNTPGRYLLGLKFEDFRVEPLPPPPPRRGGGGQKVNGRLSPSL